MHYPVVYEINTRCWLRELAEASGHLLRLDEVPESELLRWKQLGISAIWLMGVWLSGPLARAKALADIHQRDAYTRALPDWKPEDVTGSPYAISDYEAAPELGGKSGLERFRQNLHQHGLKLLLDFVPNHLGVDHAWVRERPNLFVHSAAPNSEFFQPEGANGTTWIAHGKDPYFPAWNDTAQLDYRVSETRRLMKDVLLKLATICDGVRCDMAMLLLEEVFQRTWGRFPPTGPMAQGEFWQSAIRQTKAAHPDFLFLAEAYWGLEPRLQSLGFDYTYDKSLYDKLVAGDATAVQKHLIDLGSETLARGAHFLENHDEPRIASLLELPRHRVAALLTLGLPGMRLLHEGQLTGARVRSPIQLRRRLREQANPSIQHMYEEILLALKTSAAGQERSRLLTPTSELSGCVFLERQAPTGEFDLIAVNLTDRHQAGGVPLPPNHGLPGHCDLLEMGAPISQPQYSARLTGESLAIEMPPHAARLLRFR